MNVYLMVEWIPLILTMSRQLSRPRLETHLKIHQQKLIPIKDIFSQGKINLPATGGLAGAGMMIVHNPDRKINIVGIHDHELTGLDVVTAATHLDTQEGPVIGNFHEYAHVGKGRSIHATGQMEWFNCKVDDRSKVVGGVQRIETPDGYVFPHSIESVSV